VRVPQARDQQGTVRLDHRVVIARRYLPAQLRDPPVLNPKPYGLAVERRAGDCQAHARSAFADSVAAPPFGEGTLGTLTPAS
jgi:hypothetical protein